MLNICKGFIEDDESLDSEEKQLKKSKSSQGRHKKVPEKRLARWKSNPSVKLRERITAAKSQRMYVIERKPIFEGSMKFVVAVADSLHNVSIGQLNTCDCKEYGTGILCKHILFVLIKVLKIKREVLHYQNAFVTSEMEEILEEAPPDPTAIYKKETSESRPPGEAGLVVQKAYEPSDQCPVCYEEMNTAEITVYCKGNCGHSLHAICYEEWKKARQGKGNCIYCGAEWVQDMLPIPQIPAANFMVLPEGYAMAGAQLSPYIAKDMATYQSAAYYGFNPRAYGWFQ